ncbi:MAG: c-type cytochrome, partial [Bryobacteraceae bacterium]
NRCAECHRAGEAAPMSLVTYAEVRPWAKAIQERVLEGKMPPWPASPKHGSFLNDRRLSEREIATVVEWVKAGAPEGDARELPPPPKFESGWMMGKPDAVFELPSENDVPAEGVVAYQHFTVDPRFDEDKWVQAAEIRPGNRGVVHHIIVFVRPPGAESNEATPAVRTGRDYHLVGFAPGEQPKVYQPGTAKLVKAGSKLVFQVHYTPNGKAAKDRSRVGFLFAKAAPAHEAHTSMALNARFAIPAGAANHEVTSTWTAKEDVRLERFMPHMHLRGKDFKYTAVFPDGRSEVLLEVPKYDFNWQLMYVLKEPLRLPKGTRIDCVAHFDNSANNKYNPDPMKEVRWGPQTWEEMMIGWFDYTTERRTNE